MGYKQIEKNMIPLGQKGNEEYDKSVRAKLKGTASDKRKFAQRLRRLRETKSPGKFEERCLELLKNPKEVGLTIFKILEQVKSKNDLTPKLMMELSRSYAEAYKTIFGSKSFNLNFNVNKESSAKNMEQIYFEVQEKKSKAKAKEKLEEDDERERYIEEST